MRLGFKIQFLNINESYFKGKVEFQNKEYTINIQNERRGKVLKLPFYINSKKERMLVRLTGSGDIFIDDYLPFKGENQNGLKLTLMKLLFTLLIIRTSLIPLRWSMNNSNFRRKDFM